MRRRWSLLTLREGSLLIVFSQDSSSRFAFIHQQQDRSGSRAFEEESELQKPTSSRTKMLSWWSSWSGFLTHVREQKRMEKQQKKQERMMRRKKEKKILYLNTSPEDDGEDHGSSILNSKDGKEIQFIHLLTNEQQKKQGMQPAEIRT